MKRPDPLDAAAGITLSLMLGLVWFGAIYAGGKPRAVTIGLTLAVPPLYGLFMVVEEFKHGRRW